MKHQRSQFAILDIEKCINLVFLLIFTLPRLIVVELVSDEVIKKNPNLFSGFDEI